MYFVVTIHAFDKRRKNVLKIAKLWLQAVVLQWYTCYFSPVKQSDIFISWCKTLWYSVNVMLPHICPYLVFCVCILQAMWHGVGCTNKLVCCIDHYKQAETCFVNQQLKEPWHCFTKQMVCIHPGWLVTFFSFRCQFVCLYITLYCWPAWALLCGQLMFCEIRLVWVC